MLKKTAVKFQNGLEVIVWQVGEEVYMGVVNERGYILTDRKLEQSEVDELNGVVSITK